MLYVCVCVHVFLLTHVRGCSSVYPRMMRQIKFQAKKVGATVPDRWCYEAAATSKVCKYHLYIYMNIYTCTWIFTGSAMRLPPLPRYVFIIYMYTWIYMYVRDVYMRCSEASATFTVCAFHLYMYLYFYVHVVVPWGCRYLKDWSFMTYTRMYICTRICKGGAMRFLPLPRNILVYITCIYIYTCMRDEKDKYKYTHEYPYTRIYIFTYIYTPRCEYAYVYTCLFNSMYRPADVTTFMHTQWCENMCPDVCRCINICWCMRHNKKIVLSRCTCACALQHALKHCATHWNTVQLNETLCNSMKHCATLWNSVQVILRVHDICWKGYAVFMYCVPWNLICTTLQRSATHYGVNTISRLLQIIGLFYRI